MLFYYTLSNLSPQWSLVCRVPRNGSSKRMAPRPDKFILLPQQTSALILVRQDNNHVYQHTIPRRVLATLDLSCMQSKTNAITSGLFPVCLRTHEGKGEKRTKAKVEECNTASRSQLFRIIPGNDSASYVGTLLCANIFCQFNFG